MISLAILSSYKDIQKNTYFSRWRDALLSNLASPLPCKLSSIVMPKRSLGSEGSKKVSIYKSSKTVMIYTLPRLRRCEIKEHQRGEAAPALLRLFLNLLLSLHEAGIHTLTSRVVMMASHGVCRTFLSRQRVHLLVCLEDQAFGIKMAKTRIPQFFGLSERVLGDYQCL